MTLKAEIISAPATGGPTINFVCEVRAGKADWVPDSLVLGTYSDKSLVVSQSSYKLPKVQDDGGSLKSSREVRLPRHVDKLYCRVLAYKDVSNRANFDQDTLDRSKGDLCQIRSETIEIEVKP